MIRGLRLAVRGQNEEDSAFWVTKTTIIRLKVK